MRNSNILVVASTNRHKFEEFQQLFSHYPDIQIAPAQEFLRNAEKLGLVETSEHYKENAIAKARACNLGCHYPSIADDSGIEVDALNGRPGVRSHRYSTPKLGETQDLANIKKLLEELKGVPAEKRTARFVCHLALVMEGKTLHVVGTLDGTIAMEPSGIQGFGYDPIFIPQGQSKTLAEIGNEMKNKISHRAIAVMHLMDELKSQELILAKP
jgi:XTP/dITP diphosphohydrolase